MSAICVDILEEQPTELSAESICNLLSKTTVRQRTFQKTRLIIGRREAIGVNVFVVLLPAKKPAGIRLRETDHTPVKSDTQWLAQSTGEALSRKELISYYEIGEEKVVLDKKESRLIRAGRIPEADASVEIIPSCLTPKYRMKLVGFLDAAEFDRYSLSVRDSVHFIYGSDELIEGSRDFMSAFVEALTLEKRYCIIEWQFRAESVPRLCCGVPVWSTSSVVGLYLLTVPYKDDLRQPCLHHLPEEPAALADASNDELWARVLDCAGAPNHAGRQDWSQIPDPAIQKLWHGIEILALDETHVEPFTDPTLKPLEELREQAFIDQCQDLMSALKLVSKGVKRTGASQPRRTTKRRPDSEGGSVTSYPALTVAELKHILGERGLKLTGKKQELIERLETYDKAHATQ